MNARKQLETKTRRRDIEAGRKARMAKARKEARREQEQ